MKILFITNNLPPLVDGVGDYTYNIAKQFVEHNHEVYIICRNNPQINTNVLRMTILPIINKWDYNCYKPIIKFIKEKAIDVVSLQYVPHGFHPKGLPFPIIKLTKEIKKTKSFLFTFCHELLVLPERGNIKKCILSYLMKQITKKIINNSDYAGTSNEYYKYLAENYIKVNKKLDTIPISSNIPLIKYDADYIKNLRKQIANSNETIIAFFGNRNIDTSIEVIRNLIKRGKKIKTLFIGKTAIQDNSLDANFAYKTGIINVNEISQYFQIADILLLPEDTGFGCSFKSGSLIAGLQNGTTIITTKGRMTSDLLLDKHNIIFTDFNNKNNLERLLIYYIEHPLECKRIGNNAKLQFSFINWTNTYQKYIEILKGKM